MSVDIQKNINQTATVEITSVHLSDLDKTPVKEGNSTDLNVSPKQKVVVKIVKNVVGIKIRQSSDTGTNVSEINTSPVVTIPRVINTDTSVVV
jgi:hypothetical protein